MNRCLALSAFFISSMSLMSACPGDDPTTSESVEPPPEGALSDRPPIPSWTRADVPPLGPTAAGFERVESWPDVQQSIARDTADPAVLIVTLRLRNNLGRAVEHLALLQEVTSLNEPSATAAQAASASQDWVAAAEPSGCRFALMAGRVLAPDASVDFTCRLSVAAGLVLELPVALEPEAFIGDRDYDQINDELSDEAAALGDDELIDVIVRLAGPVEPADEATFAAHGGVDRRASGLDDSFEGRLPAGDLAAYRAAAGARVWFIDPLPRFFPLLDIATTNVRATQVWTDPGLTGDPMTRIAIVDTGIDGTHPGMRQGGAAVVAGWQDFMPATYQDSPFGPAGPCAAACDPGGHGSHVAGIVAGSGAGAPGGRDLRGVAHNARLHGIRIPLGGNNANPNPAPSASRGILNALSWLATNARANNIVVANLSWGSGLLNQHTERLVARITAAGVLPVTAIGNSNSDGGFGGSPGMSNKALSVGAVDDLDQLALYSSNGLDARPTKPDVVAPGGGALITFPNNATIGGQQFITSIHSNQIVPPLIAGAPPANGYVEYNGTSMASPVVAGEAALLVDAMTDYGADDADGEAGADEDPWNGVDDDGDGIIDEDVGQWTYDEPSALALKNIISLATFEIAGGAAASNQVLWYDRNGNGQFDFTRNDPEDQNLNGVLDPGEDADNDGALTAPPGWRAFVGDELIFNPDGNLQYDPAPGGADLILPNHAKRAITAAMVAANANWAPLRAAQQPPLVAGVALRGPLPGNPYLDYLEADPTSYGVLRSNDPRRDDAGRLRGADGYDRGEQDPREGFGRVQVDAAIDAVTEELCGEARGEFGAAPGDAKVWVRHVHLYADLRYGLELDGPDAGADFDVYLYSGIPDRNGQPLIANKAKVDRVPIKMTTANTADEKIAFEVPADGLYYVVVRRVTGAGSFKLHLVTHQPWTVIVYMAAESDGRGGDLDAAAFAALNDMEVTGSGLEATHPFQVIAQVDYANRAWDGDAAKAGHAVRYCVRKDHRDTVNQYSIPHTPRDAADAEETEPNTGDPATFQRLVDWTIDHFPADRYAVIFWGAGHGWKIDPERAIGPGGNLAPAADALTLAELRGALEYTATRIAAGSNKLVEPARPAFIDLLGWDADLMQMIEIGTELRGKIGVMVGPESRQHVDGWPYAQALASLMLQPGGANPAITTDGEAWARAIVTAYGAYYTNTVPYPAHTLSALRLDPPPGQDARISRWPDLVSELSELAGELRPGIGDVMAIDDPSDNVQIRVKHQVLYASESFEDQGFIDARDFAERLQRSSVPPAYRVSAPDVLELLKPGGEIVLAEVHGPGHPAARGASIYFPRHQLLPESWAQPNLPADPTALFAPSFDNPVPCKLLYAAHPADIRLPSLVGTEHPRDALALRWTAATNWDELIYRYYRPAADACVVVAGGCVKTAFGLPGQRFTLSSAGSSDADGPAIDDVPHDYYWDHVPAIDAAGGLPPYPQPQAAPVVDVPCSEDCDRNGADASDDDPDGRGRGVPWRCSRLGTYPHVVHVWDEHHLQKAVHDEDPHGIHWNVDRSDATIICVTPWIPIKVPKLTNVVPGELVPWEAGVITGPEGGVEIYAEDTLSPELELVAGSVSCNVGTCMAGSAPDGTAIVTLSASIGPSSSVSVTYDTIARVPEELIPELPVTTRNRWRVTDLEREIVHAVDAQVHIVATGTDVCVNPDDLDCDGVDDLIDCGPDDPDVSPAALERCNGIDDDCDGVTDEDIIAATCTRGTCVFEARCVDGVEECPGSDDCQPLGPAPNPPIQPANECVTPLLPGQLIDLAPFFAEGFGPRSYTVLGESGGEAPSDLVVADGQLRVPQVAQTGGMYAFNVLAEDLTGRAVVGFVIGYPFAGAAWTVGDVPLEGMPIVAEGEPFGFEVGTAAAEWVQIPDGFAWCLAYTIDIRGAASGAFGVTSVCEPACAQGDVCLGGHTLATCVTPDTDCDPGCGPEAICRAGRCAPANVHLGEPSVGNGPAPGSSTPITFPLQVGPGWSMPPTGAGCGFITIRWTFAASPPLDCANREHDIFLQTTIGVLRK